MKKGGFIKEAIKKPGALRKKKAKRYQQVN
jgi:hypothetical protein